MSDTEKTSTDSVDEKRYYIELDNNKECRVKFYPGIMIHVLLYGYAFYGLIIRKLVSTLENFVKGIKKEETDKTNENWLVPKDFESGFYICIYDEKAKQEWIIGRENSFEENGKYSKRIVEQISKNCQIIKLKADESV